VTIWITGKTTPTYPQAWGKLFGEKRPVVIGANGLLIKVIHLSTGLIIVST
jgi:hypothetical protein